MHRVISTGIDSDGCSWVFYLLPATEELHAKQRKDNDEEEEKENEGNDGLHGVHQRDDQVSKRRPIPWQSQNEEDGE